MLKVYTIAGEFAIAMLQGEVWKMLLLPVEV